MNLPFEPTPQIFRYLETILKMDENFFIQNSGQIFTIPSYVDGDKITYKTEVLNNSFWEYLEKIGGIELLTSSEKNTTSVKFHNLEKSNELLYPEKQKLKILNIKKIREIYSDLFKQNQKTKSGTSSSQKNSHIPNNSVISINSKRNRLVINKNTGDVELNKIKSQLNPCGNEFEIILKLATSKDYVATYKDLLGDNPTKTNKRNLSFTIRNIKETLLILPRNKAKNKDVIKNIRNYGYKFEI